MEIWKKMWVGVFSEHSVYKRQLAYLYYFIVKKK